MSRSPPNSSNLGMAYTKINQYKLVGVIELATFLRKRAEGGAGEVINMPLTWD